LDLPVPEEQPDESASKRFCSSSSKIPPLLKLIPPSIPTTAHLNEIAGSPIDQLCSLEQIVRTNLEQVQDMFSSNYEQIMKTSKSTAYDECQLCSSIKPKGTLYSLSPARTLTDEDASQPSFPFLQSTSFVCTLCYFNLIDQWTLYEKQNITSDKRKYQKPEAHCYLCNMLISFQQTEIKLLETNYFPFLFDLNSLHHSSSLYDNKRLALACDHCFYALLFQYIDYEKKNVSTEKRKYKWYVEYPIEKMTSMEMSY
ncbi:unnamed protein product, partial [Didymodactylos carnosus]